MSVNLFTKRQASVAACIDPGQLLAVVNHGMDLNDVASHASTLRAPLVWSHRWLAPRHDEATWELIGVSDSIEADLSWWHHYLTGTHEPLGQLLADGWLTVYSEIRFPYGETWLLRLDRPATSTDIHDPRHSAPQHLRLRQAISYSRWIRDRAAITETENKIDGSDH